MNIYVDIININNIETIANHIQPYTGKANFYTFTPYSSYLLDKLNISFLPISKFYTSEQYKEDTLNIYNSFFNKYTYLQYYKYPLSLLIASILQDDFKYNFILRNGDYLYITDRNNNIENIYDNNSNFYIKYLESNKIIFLKKNLNNKSMFKSVFLQLTFKNIIKAIRILFSFLTLKFTNKYTVISGYDWLYFYLYPYILLNHFTNSITMSSSSKKKKYNFFKNYKLSTIYNEYLNDLLNEFNLYSDYSDNFTKTKAFCVTSLGNNAKEYFVKKQIFQIHKNICTYQHGSYLYHTSKNHDIDALYETEIMYSNINFVFNDYTKKLFEDLGAKKVYSVGSILFNKPIKKRKKEYDFLYITQGHDYAGNICYVDFRDSLHSFDGYELYQRHKNIIHLFGKKFKEKKIIIRVHPLVVNNGLYVPFWELAENYDNITIDVSTPIYTLIEKTKYIISDYFTTEFINRELHYKRDIILFQGAPTPLPEETIEDMNKMFILVDKLDHLEQKIYNIEGITKNRKRYDDIIEYYSSKECDTKKIVTEILENE